MRARRHRAGTGLRIAGGIALVVALVWGYVLYQQHSARNAVIAMLNDTSGRLRATLHAAPGTDHADSHARAAEAHRQRLRKMRSSSFLPLADAADDYLVTAREILRRRAAMRSSGERLAKSTEAVKAHLLADRGAAGWIRQAVRLKEVVDRDLRAYRIASDAYASLLTTLASSQAGIAPYVQPTALIEEKSIADARERALDALARTDENTSQATRLDAYRGSRARR